MNRIGSAELVSLVMHIYKAVLKLKILNAVKLMTIYAKDVIFSQKKTVQISPVDVVSFASHALGLCLNMVSLDSVKNVAKKLRVSEN